MSQQNVEFIRSVSEPFAGIDVAGIDWDSDAIREIFDGTYAPDFELRTLESGLGTGVDGIYHGWDGWLDYIQDWLEPFGEYHVEWLEYIDAGEYVLVPTRQWGIGRASGARAELELTWVYELRGGKVARAFQYDTVDNARKAVAEMERERA